jgi:(4S)-4-hydroxy-5-phosphonooxypentane-2,3-dione isomerase
MPVATISIRVKPEFISKFIEATIINHDASIKEPGNLRFDFLQSSEDPSHFILYEAYESEESAFAHKKTPHYATWKETVSTWMLKPRESATYTMLRPNRKP